MKKSVEELMKPRYKVVADYPGMPFLSDQIIEREGTNGTDDYYHPFNNKNICLNRYPNLFKKLEWWEERKQEEMPEYVKFAADGMVKRITHWDMETSSPWFMYLEGDNRPYSPGGLSLENTHWLPATEEEYNNYISSHFVNV